MSEEFGKNENDSYLFIDFAKKDKEVEVIKCNCTDVDSKHTITSMTRFREKYKARIGECYIIHPRNLLIKDGIVCIPPYMTMCL